MKIIGKLGKIKRENEMKNINEIEIYQKNTEKVVVLEKVV